MVVSQRDRPEAQSALAEIEAGVAHLLYEWEDSDVLYDDAARKICALILRHNRLDEAHCEIGHIRAQR